MSLKRVFQVATLVIIILNSIIIFGNAYESYSTENIHYNELVLNILDTTFSNNKSELIGNAVIGDKQIITEFLEELHRKEKLEIKYDGFTNLKIGNFSSDCFSKSFTLRFNGQDLGVISLCKDIQGRKSALYSRIFYSTTLQILFFLIAGLLLQRLIKNIILTPITNIISEDRTTNNDIKNAPIEIVKIFERIHNLKQQLIAKAAAETEAKIAKQVAHDIQSPLAALELVMEDIKNLPEDSRELTLHALNRIKDIANNLSKDARLKEQGSLCIPSIVLANVINEKKIEYQEKAAIQISLTDETNRREFVAIRESELSRIVSNLVNNSVEALGRNGSIQVKLSCDQDNLILQVRDNGKGFPEDFLKKGVLRGHTVGKQGGQGLGLSHAKETVETAKGHLNVSNSTTGGGLVEITIPKSATPSWFKSHLKLSDKKRAIIIDDDKSIHNVWKKLVKDKCSGVQIIDLFSEEEINTYLERVTNDDYVLIDYDLRQPLNGLDYIKNFNPQNVALVTSNYDTFDVVSYCSKNDIQLIPKQIVSSIDII